jgi:hypothetical protein
VISVLVCEEKRFALCGNTSWIVQLPLDDFLCNFSQDGALWDLKELQQRLTVDKRFHIPDADEPSVENALTELLCLKQPIRQIMRLDCKTSYRVRQTFQNEGAQISVQFASMTSGSIGLSKLGRS